MLLEKGDQVHETFGADDGGSRARGPPCTITGAEGMKELRSCKMLTCAVKAVTRRMSDRMPCVLAQRFLIDASRHRIVVTSKLILSRTHGSLEVRTQPTDPWLSC